MKGENGFEPFFRTLAKLHTLHKTLARRHVVALAEGQRQFAVSFIPAGVSLTLLLLTTDAEENRFPCFARLTYG